jgi:hypothetical protein
MIDYSSKSEDSAPGSKNPWTTTWLDEHTSATWTNEELLEGALEMIHQLGEKAEKSKETKDFDPELPLEPKNIRALAYIQRKDASEYNRIQAKLNEAKPAPDLTLLNRKPKSKTQKRDWQGCRHLQRSPPMEAV